jgi:hypothetical protein
MCKVPALRRQQLRIGRSARVRSLDRVTTIAFRQLPKTDRRSHATYLVMVVISAVCFYIPVTPRVTSLRIYVCRTRTVLGQEFPRRKKLPIADRSSLELSMSHIR